MRRAAINIQLPLYYRWEGTLAALLFALVWPFVLASVLWAWVRGR